MGRRDVPKTERVSPRALPRFFVAEESLRTGVLPEPIAHQVQHVLRLREGDHICLLDGGREVAIARLSQQGRFEIVDRQPAPPEPPVAITLLQSLLRQEKLEQVIRLSVQGGASAVWIAPSQRSIVRLEAPKQPHRLIRWQKIATEEAELAYRAKVPAVQIFESWQEAFQSLPRPVLVLEEWEGVQPLASTIRSEPLPDTLSLVVGPEGGFSPEERAWMQSQQSCCAVSLGTRILRTENAGFYALAQLWAVLQVNRGF